MAGNGEIVDVDMAGPTKAAPEAVEETKSTPEVQKKPAIYYLLPVGPICPFRSTTMTGRNLDDEIAAVVLQAMQFEPEFAKFAQVLISGLPVDKSKARELGSNIVMQSENLRKILDGMEFASDFQATETYLLMTVSCEKKGVLSARNIQEYMRWQGEGLQDLADGKDLPPPPEAVRPMLESTEPAPAPAPSGIPPPRSYPFGDNDFRDIPSEEAKKLREEYDELIRDHEKLIAQGESYDGFGTEGQETYLDKIESITHRWEELIASVLAAGGALSPQFVQLSSAYLLQTESTPVEFRTLVKDTHDLMRTMARRKA